MPSQSNPDREPKQYIVLILCFMLVIAGVARGWFATVLWMNLALALALILYVWAFHIHWRGRS